MRLTLIRHGVTEWNALGRWQGHADTPLSEQGERQAQLLGHRLRGAEFDLVCSSDLQRALRTARIALPDAEIATDARLREVHFGEWDGQNVDKNRLHPLWNAWADDPWRTPAPGGESFAQVATRARSWIDGLPADANVIAFSHSVFIRSLLCELLGVRVTAREGWTFPFPFSLGHATLTRVARHHGEWAIELFGDGAHLEPWTAPLLNQDRPPKVGTDDANRPV